MNFVRTVEAARGFGTTVIALVVPQGEDYVDAGSKLRARRVRVTEVLPA